MVSLGRNPSLGLIAAGGPRLPVLTRMAAQARIFDHLVKVMQTCADPHSDQRRRVPTSGLRRLSQDTSLYSSVRVIPSRITLIT